MNLVWTDEGWSEYVSWQEKQHLKLLKRINSLISESTRTPSTGSGKPEPLKHEYQGYWSRRIDDTHRLVYKITERQELMIIKCRFHY